MCPVVRKLTITLSFENSYSFPYLSDDKSVDAILVIVLMY